MTEAVRLRVDGALARITLQRPPLNVLSTSMLHELRHALQAAAAASDVRLIRLDAEGKLFSAGVDVADHVGQKIAPMMDALTELFLTLDALPVPLVSVVQGPALGGGCELALATDLCWASERAAFGLPEVRLGLFAPPASVLLPRLIGERRALWLLLSGETLTAAEAQQMGIVNAVFPEERLEREVDERQQRLLSLSGAALRFTKRAVRAARGLAAGEAHRELRRLYVEELMRTHDAGEGLSAFLEKRSPDWKHA